jgi:hypothetical protein
MGKPPYRTTSSSIDPWEFIRRPRTGGQIPHDFEAASIWLRDYLDRQYGVATAERRTCTARGRGRPEIFHCLFSKPGTEDRKATLAGCQERRFAVVKPIIAKRENKALSSSDQPTFIQ